MSMRAFAAILVAGMAVVEPRASERSCAGRTGFASGTVGEVAGRLRDRGSLYLLEDSPRPSVLVFPASCAEPRRIPLRSESRFPSGGLARASDGSLCALSGDNRRIECFDESSGRRVRQSELDVRAQSVWTIRDLLMYARFEQQAGRPLLFRESGNGFEPDRAFMSRPPVPRPDFPFRAPGPEAAGMVENLVQCGLGTSESVPCWRMLTGELRFVGPPGGGAEIPMPDVPGRARAFPLRDALQTPSGVLWLLVNDPPENRDQPAGLGRKLVRMQKGQMRVAPLEPPARMLLDGDDTGVLLLFRDGSAARREAGNP